MVSKVNNRAVLAAEVLPARSIWRTCTLFAPGTEVKLLDQVAPPLVLYWTVAPVSTPVRVNKPLFVILSVVLVPLSVVKATVGLFAVISSVTFKVAVLAAPILPA